MKVHELISVLQSLNRPDHEVITEGCDCYGHVENVMVDEEHWDYIEGIKTPQPAVLLNRPSDKS